MARITVEDCLEQVPNIFDLVMVASKRARRLANGAPALIEWENDKPTVVALREVAAGLVTMDILAEADQRPEDLFANDQSEDLLPPISMNDSLHDEPL